MLKDRRTRHPRRQNVVYSLKRHSPNPLSNHSLCTIPYDTTLYSTLQLDFNSKYHEHKTVPLQKCVHVHTEAGLTQG